MPAVLLEQIELVEETEEKRKRLRQEIKEYDGQGKRNVGKVREFMENHGIWELSELDYEWRQKFAKELKDQVSPGIYSGAVKTFDHLKRYSLRKRQRFRIGQGISKYPYENRLLFLPYHPVQELVKRIDHMPERAEWVWDFSLPAPELMKRQMYICLNGILKKDGDLLHVRLAFLHLFYQFCVKEQVADIELIGLEQEQAYRQFLKKLRKTKDFGILDMCRCILFVEDENTRWESMVWYPERFQLAPGRTDPAHPVVHLSFVEVTHDGNRALLQEYMRYGLGLTDISLSFLRAELLQIRAFLQQLGENACEVSQGHIERYLNQVQERNIKPGTFNKKVTALLHFYDFLLIRRYIEKLPFCAEYYLKKTFLLHHNRSVPEETAEEILDNLYQLPETLRLMYLHLWATGLRISEVCRLKGDAYYIRGRDAWLQVYQTKMKNYKQIPIPEALYQLMQVYLKRHEIGADAYVFQNKNAGAYRSATFRVQMIRWCRKLGIRNGEYMFQSHDYRHGLATYFYDNGVSLQGVRDYLGHDYEEMTQQYVDFMPKRIDHANQEFFKKQGNSLASCLKGGEEN